MGNTRNIIINIIIINNNNNIIQYNINLAMYILQERLKQEIMYVGSGEGERDPQGSMTNREDHFEKQMFFS